MFNIVKSILLSVLGYLKADWYLLLIGILLAVVINVYVDSNKLRKLLERRAGMSVPAAVAFGAFTPLCACGTTAVLLSMFISSMPWGPVMAFLISSPLTSPSTFMFETAFLGSSFAVAMLVSSIVLGVASGFLAHVLSKKTKFFNDQFRLVTSKNKNTGCCKTASNCSCSVEETACSCGCGGDTTSQSKGGFIKRYKLDELMKGLIDIGLKKVLLYFVIFIAVGKVFEMLIPKEWIMTLFSSSKAYSIPLSATLGLPLYLNDSSALPLLKSFANSGAGQGALLAFLITGKATGIPVITGLSTIIKKKAMLFYVGFIYFGGILCGVVYQLLLNLK